MLPPKTYGAKGCRCCVDLYALLRLARPRQNHAGRTDKGVQLQSQRRKGLEMDAAAELDLIIAEEVENLHQTRVLQVPEFGIKAAFVSDRTHSSPPPGGPTVPHDSRSCSTR